MTQDEFDSRVCEMMTRRPFAFLTTEPPVSESEVAKVEAKLGTSLPHEFKHFAMTFGGGDFGSTIIASLREDSNCYVLSYPSVKVDGRPMLVVSDDQCGGYNGFLFDGGSYEERIIYNHPDDGNYTVEAAPSFFAFIEKHELSR